MVDLSGTRIGQVIMDANLVALEGLGESRYGIAKSTLYDRMKKIGIIPTKKGRRSFISIDECNRMDRLNVYLKEGGSCEDFEPTIRLDSSEIEVASKQEAYADMLMLIEAISKHFKQESADPLANQKALLFAAENSLILPSSQIKQLIGKKPSKLVFLWGRFQIEKVGKVGRESGWAVYKDSDKLFDF
jgi:hypothetical protein